MDLVYIVKEGERNDDLKYSLRSVAKFVKCDNVWIVGYKPSWVTNVRYIPVKQTENKWKNSVKNIKAACENSEISSDFILMNDDFFAIEPINDLRAATNLSLGLLDKQIATSKDRITSWAKAFQQVSELLEELHVEKPYYNYESHTPLLINKQKYLEVMNLPEVIAFQKTSKVLHKRSLYKNIYPEKVQATVLSQDVKISGKDTSSDKSKVCGWLSVSDNVVGNGKFKELNELLRKLFFEPCKYEKEIEKRKPIRRKRKLPFINY